MKEETKTNKRIVRSESKICGSSLQLELERLRRTGFMEKIGFKSGVID